MKENSCCYMHALPVLPIFANETKELRKKTCVTVYWIWAALKVSAVIHVNQITKERKFLTALDKITFVTWNCHVIKHVDIIKTLFKAKITILWYISWDKITRKIRFWSYHPPLLQTYTYLFMWCSMLSFWTVPLRGGALLPKSCTISRPVGWRWHHSVIRMTWVGGGEQ